MPLPNMLLSVAITIHLFDISYTLNLLLNIDLGLDVFQYDVDNGDHDMHLEYSFDFSDDEIFQDAGWQQLHDSLNAQDAG